MSRPALVAIGLWLLVVTGLGAVIWGARAPLAPATRAATAALRPPASPSPGPYPSDSLRAVVEAGDLFRVDRRPAVVPYDPDRAGATSPPPTASTKPALSLDGIVWGEVPEAIIEGLPGTDGPRVLRLGEAWSGLRVRVIEPGRVIVAGMDTSWTLTVRIPWR